MSSTVEHFSHRKHPLVLKGDDVIAVDSTCSVCNKPVIGAPTYTCTAHDIDCQQFYLHKSCAELPKQIIRHKQDEHPLTLLPRPKDYNCDICTSDVMFAYACDDCEFDVCVVCAFISCFVSEERVIRHQGHPEHALTLQREASFKCDACWEETKDFAYVCFACDFWIHKKCAYSPPIIPRPSYHHHSLALIFYIPIMHRYFGRYCPICKERVQSLCWCYYCHKCTFFVHLKCSTSTISLGNETEENGIGDDEPDLIQFPLPGEESLFDLIITQRSKFPVEIQDQGENSTASILPMATDPNTIEEHWSHPDHPLELRQFTVNVNDKKDDSSDNEDDRRVLMICDGCVQPITISHPWYYACTECGFFLHAFCANQLPDELPAGASPFHPQHILYLRQEYKFYSFVTCAICDYSTNGFYYECDCETCDIKIDIRCAFLPAKIRHKSHRQHALVQLPRPTTNTTCSVSRMDISDTLGYACETCSTFQIHMLCIFHPGTLKHRYDDHFLTLRHPPFFYEGVFYCQICEDQVNNQWWLYFCDGCDQSFHEECLRPYINVKVGGTIKHSIDNRQHTLALVLKNTTRKNALPYSCGVCGDDYKFAFFFECEGCGYLVCIYCIRTIHGE